MYNVAPILTSVTVNTDNIPDVITETDKIPAILTEANKIESVKTSTDLITGIKTFIEQDGVGHYAIDTEVVTTTTDMVNITDKGVLKFVTTTAKDSNNYAVFIVVIDGVTVFESTALTVKPCSVGIANMVNSATFTFNVRFNTSLRIRYYKTQQTLTNVIAFYTTDT